MRLSVPGRAFTAEQPDDDGASRSAHWERRLTRRTAKDIWHTAKPLVGPVVDFDRPDDTEIYDNAFLELHTYLGCRQDLYAKTGAGDFAEDTTRERTPTGSYHRNCIRKLSIEQQRANHRAAMAYKESYAVLGDGIRHVVFETNHPNLDVTDGDADEKSFRS